MSPLHQLLAISCLLTLDQRVSAAGTSSGGTWGHGSVHKHNRELNIQYEGCDEVTKEVWNTGTPRGLLFTMQVVDRDEIKVGGTLWSDANARYILDAYLGVGHICNADTIPTHSSIELLFGTTPNLQRLSPEGGLNLKEDQVHSKQIDEIRDLKALDENRKMQTACIYICCHMPEDAKRRGKLVGNGCTTKAVWQWQAQAGFDSSTKTLITEGQISSNVAMITNIFYACCMVDLVLTGTLLFLCFVGIHNLS